MDRARGRMDVRLTLGLLVVLLAFAVSAARADAAAVPLIVDTDMFSDADDAGALATAYGLQYRGEAKVIATVVNTRTSRPAVSTNSWRCVEAINAFYGSSSVPVGTSMPNNGPSTNDGGFAGSCGDLAPSFKAPETALTVYRRALAGAADGSVVIASVGYMNNLSALLNSSPDSISSLTGRQLVAQKVKMLVAMGGGYPSRTGETNLGGDPAAAQNVADNWPTKLVWSGYEVGNTVYTGQTLSSVHPADSPVRQSYEAFTQAQGTAISSWDLTAVYHAVRPDDAILREVGPGKNSVSRNGANTFASGTGNQYYLVKSDSSAVARAIEQQLDTLSPTADTTPPAISGVGASGSTVAWTTDEPATSQVEYGTTTAYGTSTTLDTARTTSHSQTLSALQPATTYHYRVKSRDAAGNLATSTDFTFRTADTVPPVISGVSATSDGDVSWATDEPATSQVEYGTTTSYGSTTTLDTTRSTSHSQTLGGLASNTTYHYRVRSTDAAGNTATSTDGTFTTPDTAPPVISGVSVSGSTVAWTTDEPATSQVEYGTTTAYGSTTTLDATRTTDHGQSLSGLRSSTTYHYRVKSTDAAGNTATSTDRTFTTADTDPPVISAVSDTGSTVSWTTDEPATSQVQYGTTTAYGSSSTPDATLTTAHSQTLAGLAADTTYHYRVKSTDAAGNTSMSPDFTLTTPPPPDTTAPAISTVRAGSITPNGATISWATDEAGTSQVEYGTSTGYGSSTTLDTTRTTTHSQGLSGLAAGTLYHYRVKSRDAAGNLATSPDATFTTSPPPDTSPPVISAVSATSGGTVSWTTDEGATSQVEYGTTSAYGSSTTLDSARTTSHAQTLPSLKAGTTYHYRVKSSDAAGNPSTSADFTFTTPPPPDTTAPVISNVTVSGSTVTWTTDEPATSQVEYGTSTGYGSATTPDATRSTTHSQTLDGLRPATTYHVRVKSTDAAGNAAASADFSFKTPDAPSAPAPSEPSEPAPSDPAPSAAPTVEPSLAPAPTPAATADAPGCVVPNLTGRTKHGALVLLVRHRCTLGRVTFARHLRKHKRVVSQSLTSQTRRPHGYRVSIIIR
jgi:hypothetical protein